MSWILDLERRARDAPDAVAVHLQEGGLRLGELWPRVQAFARFVRRRSEDGDCILLALPNGADFLVAFLGTQWAGRVAVPISSASGAARIGRTARAVAARAVVLAGEPPPERSAGLPTWSAADGEPGRDRPWDGATRVAFLQHTSGTSGDPKAVEILHRGLDTNLRQMEEGFRIGRDDRFVSWLPVHHDMGLILMTLLPLVRGLPCCLLPSDASGLRRWLSTLERFEATFTAAPDFAWRHLLRTRRGGLPPLPGLRVALNAAETVRPKTAADFAAALGRADVMTPAYGLAEATVGVAGHPPGEVVHIDAGFGVSVGRPFPGIELAIDESTDADGLGEILVRTPARCGGYRGDAAASAALVDGTGFLHTGDLGALDDEGRLYVLGRRKEMVIVAGETLAPVELEEVVEQVPGVRSAAAVGVDRGRLPGEELWIFAEVRLGAQSPEAIFRERVLEIVTRLHRELGVKPARVQLLPSGGLPRTANGKLQRGRLRRAVRSGELPPSLFPRSPGA